MKYKVDIEIYEEYGEGFFAQEKYLVHGYDDVFWTSDLTDAIIFLKHSIQQSEDPDGLETCVHRVKTAKDDILDLLQCSVGFGKYYEQISERLDNILLDLLRS